MSEKLVGITIIGIGTSLPELVTSIMAALKKESDIAVGNIVGSSLFNILFVLGLSITISPISIERGMIIDFIFLMAVTLRVFLSGRSNRTIDKKEGIMLIIMYVGYIVYTIMNS